MVANHVRGRYRGSMTDWPVGRLQSSQVLRPNIRWTQLGRVMIRLCTVSDIVCSVDLVHCLQKMSAAAQEKRYRENGMRLTAATRSDWSILFLMRFVTSSALVFPLENQAMSKCRSEEKERYICRSDVDSEHSIGRAFVGPYSASSTRSGSPTRLAFTSLATTYSTMITMRTASAVNTPVLPLLQTVLTASLIAFINLLRHSALSRP
jgi:hypothetical protein